MRRKDVLAVLVGAGLLTVASQLVAHHSATGLFSREEEVVLTGGR